MEVPLEGEAILWAGDPTESSTALGHRLHQARFGNLHGILVYEDVVFVFDFYFGALHQIKDDISTVFAGKITYPREPKCIDGPKDEASFNSVWGMTLTPNGSMLLVDKEADCVRMINPAGFVSTLTPKWITTSNSRLHGICAAPNGYYYLTATDSESIVVITPDLAHIQMVPTDKPVPRERRLLVNAEGLKADVNGDLYISDHKLNQILRFNTNTYAMSVACRARSPRDVSIAKPNLLVISENSFDSTIQEVPTAAHYLCNPYDKTLLLGENYDFVGFDVLLPSEVPRNLPVARRFFVPTSTLLARDQTYETASLHLAPPESLLLLPAPHGPLEYHSHILDLLGVPETLSSALSYLTFDRTSYPTLSSIDFAPSLPNIFLRFLYSCGTSCNLEHLSKFEQLVASAALSITLNEFGFSSQRLSQTFADAQEAVPLDKEHTELLQWIVASRTAHPLMFVAMNKLGLDESPTQKRWTIDHEIASAMHNNLLDASSRLIWSETRPLLASLESNHVWAIAISGQEGCVLAADWILFTRWRYFRRALASGLEEANSRVLELPSDLTPDLVLLLVRYLYTLRIEKAEEWTSDRREIISQLAALFEFSDFEGAPSPGFDALIALCTSPCPTTAILPEFYHREVE